MSLRDDLMQDLKEIFASGEITEAAAIAGQELTGGGIFRKPFLRAEVGVGVASSEPTLTVLDEDLAALPLAAARGDQVDLLDRGETWYLHEQQPGGNGMTVLILVEG